MSIVTTLVDRLFPPRPELVACREAHADLWISSAAEEAAGIDWETDRFAELNGLANDTDVSLTRVERWFRLMGGTGDLVRTRTETR
jgi:hypothetical protein